MFRYSRTYNWRSLSWYSRATLDSEIDIKKTKIEISGIGLDMNGPKIDGKIGLSDFDKNWFKLILIFINQK